jgi:signal transduction histidine kinase
MECLNAICATTPGEKRERTPHLKCLNTIQSKLILLLVVALVPVALLHASIYYKHFEEQRAQAIQTNLTVARAVAATFAEFVSDLSRQEQVIGSAIAVLPLSDREVYWLLEMGKLQKGLIPGLAWADVYGRIVAATDPTVVGMDLNDRRYYQEISSGKDWALSNLVASKITGRPHVIVARGIREEDGALKGVVITPLIPEQLNRILGLERIAPGCSIIFLDGNGNTVYSHSEKPQGESGWLRNLPFLKEARAGNDVATEMSGEDDKKHFVALTAVSGTGWVIAAGRPASDAISPIVSFLWYEAGIFGLVAIPSLMICLTISKKIVLPIKALREQALSFEHGESTPGIDIGGPVELQDLAQVFKSMNARIRARQEALRRSRDSLEIRVYERTQELKETLESLRKEIDERAQAEARISEGKALLQTAFNGISEPLMMLGNDMAIKIINECCHRYYGISSSQDVIGKPCYEGFRGRTSPCENCPVLSAISGEGPTTVERSGLFDPDAIEQVVTYPIREGAKGDSGAIVRICNITEKVKIQKQMIRADRLASLGQLSGGIAHEIRNPLMGISLFTDLLGDGEKFSRTREELKILDEIKDNTRKISGIIKRVLDFAKPSDTNFAELELAPLIQNTVKLWHHKMRGGSNGLKIAIEDALPYIHGDAIEIQQVVTNLIRNAFEAVPSEGKIEVDVFAGKLSCTKNRPAVIIEIRDNGPGISAEHRNSLFNPFFTTKATGTGLGLSIAHQIVARHGGMISFESTRGVGTTFRVEFPVPVRS